LRDTPFWEPVVWTSQLFGRFSSSSAEFLSIFSQTEVVYTGGPGFLPFFKPPFCVKPQVREELDLRVGPVKGFWAPKILGGLKFGPSLTFCCKRIHRGDPQEAIISAFVKFL